MLHQSEFRRFVMLTAVSVSFAVAVWVVYVLAFAHLRDSATVLAETKRELALLEEESSVVERSREALRELEPERMLLASAFIRLADPLPLIERIESIGEATNVTTELSVNLGESGDRYTLAIVGTLGSVAQFLAALESFDFFLALEDAEVRRLGLSTSSADRSAGSKFIVSSVRLTISFQPIRP